MKYIISVVIALALTGVALAKTGVSLTVYNDNLALVRDVREMEFLKGTGEVLFRDVSGQIDGTSVHFKAPGVELLEQNFDYDLVSPEKLLQKYVDRQIEIVTEKGDIASGTLLVSGLSGGQIIIRQSDGSLRSLLLDKAAEIRYPDLPEGLLTRPTLRWLVKAGDGGKKEAEVSYLTTGLSWRADYVMVIREKTDKADLDAWVTINNTSGTSYKDAKLKLIAGEIHRAEQPRTGAVRKLYKEVAMAADAQFEERAFFEYHLYTLQRPATVLDQQTKQISLFPLTSVKTKRIYDYDWQRKQDRVGVSLEFENSQENGLGMAIPAGRVRVYQQDDGGQEFIGEDNVQHTPKNEKIRVRVGEAFDIAVERKQTDLRRISDRVTETDYEVKLRNHKSETVEIVVVDYFWGDWDIIRESVAHKKISSTKLEFRVTVEPEKEAVLTYTIRQR
ncbi:DUF4139 domain-containing protein [bacterium]|nr:DUF4139 domain-containing protein [bacterium]MBU1983686.1 DUF4139 domain-containing protein [bacterium]